MATGAPCELNTSTILEQVTICAIPIYQQLRATGEMRICEGLDSHSAVPRLLMPRLRQIRGRARFDFCKHIFSEVGQCALNRSRTGRNSVRSKLAKSVEKRQCARITVPC